MSYDKYDNPLRIGYVVKRYPRYSETFIVTEILAHEEAGLEIEIFSLYPPVDTHFQDLLARVRAPVTYLPPAEGRFSRFWDVLREAARDAPAIWAELASASGEEARTVFFAALIAGEARRKGIRHLHSHFATEATSVARLAARLGGLSYSFTAHAKDIYHENVRPEEMRLKLRDASCVITVSDYNLAYLTEQYGEDASRVRRVYNGIDLERFPYDEPANRPRRIVFVGRLVEKKGLPDLIDACAILAARGVPCECQIIGTGEIEASLRDRIDRMGLRETVKLLGPCPQMEVIRSIREASVVAAPCVIGADGNRDGLPTVLLEAMALGTPCVSTDVTGIPEAIRHGDTGLLVPQRDPEALAEALGRLLDDPGLRVGLASNARSLIESEFDVRRNASLSRSILHEAAGARLLAAQGVP